MTTLLVGSPIINRLWDQVRAEGDKLLKDWKQMKVREKADRKCIKELADLCYDRDKKLEAIGSLIEEAKKDNAMLNSYAWELVKDIMEVLDEDC
jgi:hypothetical protein